MSIYSLIVQLHLKQQNEVFSIDWPSDPMGLKDTVFI